MMRKAEGETMIFFGQQDWIEANVNVESKVKRSYEIEKSLYEL